ncbi:MAG TPA: hypothetical protein VGP69_07225 [Gaiellaceae bacterium]|nr:hypothetical protein [Gaiellaceae bacterium]
MTLDELARRVRRPTGARLPTGELHAWLLAEGFATEDDSGVLYPTASGTEIGSLLELERALAVELVLIEVLSSVAIRPGR